MNGSNDWPPPLTRARLIRVLTIRWLGTVLLVVICSWLVGLIIRGNFQTRDWFWLGGLAVLLLVNIGLTVWLTRNLIRRWRQQEDAETSTRGE